MFIRSPLRALLLAVAGATLLATGIFWTALAADGLDAVDGFLIVTFAILFGWISFWCFLTAVGFSKLWQVRRVRRKRVRDRPKSTTKLASSAVLFPIHNENPEQVFARVRAMMESLEQTGHAHSFELFVLSDTTDPDIWLREELSWAELRREHPREPRLFYRRRALKFRKKSGNIADFCQRWGERYRYMIVLDADSVMDGDTMVELVRRMECAPQLGILQAPTLPAMRHSLYARREQFAASLYGPALFAGLAVCFEGAANFWGHNAIVRVRAFVAHCGLPVLSGPPPLGGPILSHDFVEAGLMRRAGYEVQLAWDLTLGSYEQPPASLASAAVRDRRWCQGNLQHLRLLFCRGFAFHTRLHFAIGVLSYAASAVWGLFLCAFGIQYYRQHLSDPHVHAAALDRATLGVLLVVFVFLFVGKAFGVFLALCDRREAAAYGGPLRLVVSVCLETLLGTLIAPILMVHHVVAILAIALGTSTDWHSASREESIAPLRDAWRAHGLMSIAGALIGAGLLWRLPALGVRLTPIWLSFLLSVPLAAALSSASLGKLLRARGLLVSLAEARPSAILQRIVELLPRREVTSSTFSERYARLIQDPWLNALHIALLQSTGTRLRPRSVIEKIAARVSASDPSMLSRKETLALLSDSWAIRTLHEAHLRQIAGHQRQLPNARPA